MSQTTPSYLYATGKAEKPIVDALISKYGVRAVTWPIALSQRTTGATVAYLYERNATNQINAEGDDRPKSSSGLPEYFIDYTSTPRVCEPRATYLEPFIDVGLQNSYEHILQQEVHSTVDLDYVWRTGESFKGFELTTFWVEFVDKAAAAGVVSKMNRRPSWQGPNGAHAMHKIADAAADLSVDYYLACANTLGKVGTDLKIDGNVLLFPMTHHGIETLSKGKVPADSVFLTFDRFLEWL